MAEYIKKAFENGNKWRVFEIILIPLITWFFMYYGAFVKLETRFDLFCQSYQEFKQDVKVHMQDREIHK